MRADNCVECGGLTPLFADRSCPGELHVFGDVSDRPRQASAEYSGNPSVSLRTSKLPHST